MLRDPRDGSATRLDDICDISVQPIHPKMGQMQLNGHSSLAIAIRWTESSCKNETQEFLKSFTQPTREAIFNHVDANGNESLITENYTLKLLLNRQMSEQTVLLSSFRLLLVSFTVLAGVLLLRMSNTQSLAVLLCISLGLNLSMIIFGAIGLTWNIVTLSALTFVSVLMVDTPVVLATAGTQAMKDQWKNFSSPLLVSLLTTLIALFPIWTLKDGPGEYIHTMFPVLAITLITVFLISIIVIPLVISEKEGLSKLSEYYAISIQKGHKWRHLSWALWIILAIIALFTLTQLEKQGVPSSIEDGYWLARIEFPVETSEQQINKAMQTWQDSWDAIADKDDWSLETIGEDPPAIMEGLRARFQASNAWWLCEAKPETIQNFSEKVKDWKLANPDVICLWHPVSRIPQNHIRSK